MNKLKKNKFKFLIVSPKQSCGGGPIVLHKLCELLIQYGFNAKIIDLPVYDNRKTGKFNGLRIIKNVILKYIKYYSIVALIIFPKKCRKWRQESIKNYKTKLFPIYNKNRTIVVYPEIVFGNPLNANKVVRWLLSYDKFNGDKYYNDTDLFFAYREQFNDPILNANQRFLQLHDFDSELYKRYNFGKRKGTCYIIRKGCNRTDLPDSFDGIVIDDLSEKEKVKVFNESEKCISYDMQTFYTTIASLCGCDVECVLEEGKKKSDYLKTEDTVYGVAYGNSEAELEYARMTKPKIKERLESFQVNNIKNVEYFIKECESYFG